MFLLMHFGTFGNMTKVYRKKAREYGYTDTNQFGRDFVRGKRASEEGLKQAERNMKMAGHDVRQTGWTKEARTKSMPKEMTPYDAEFPSNRDELIQSAIETLMN